MAISAQRFTALDQSTNLPIASIKQIKDNGIYSKLSAGADTVKMETAAILNNPEVLKLKGNINTLLASSDVDLTKLSGTVTDSLRSVIKTLSLPKDLSAMATTQLKDFGGQITGMVTKSMNLGRKVLCPISGMLDYLSGVFKFKNTSPGVILGQLVRSLKQINKKLCNGGGASVDQMMRAPTLVAGATTLNSTGQAVVADKGLGLNWAGNKIPKDLMATGSNVIKYTKANAILEATKAAIPNVSSINALSKIDLMMA